MDNFEFEIDPSGGTPPRKTLPPGWQTAQVTSVSVGPLKTGRGMAMDLIWTITEGEYEKACVFQKVIFEHENPDAERIGRYMLTDICLACGLVGTLTNTDDLLWKPCAIKVATRADKDGQYPDRDEVRRVEPVKARVPAAQQAQAALEKATKKPPSAFKPMAEDLDDQIPF
jgi:hypothetical protein